MILELIICISVLEMFNWRVYQMVWWVKGGFIFVKFVLLEMIIFFKLGFDLMNFIVGNVLVCQCLFGSFRIVMFGGYDRLMLGWIMGYRSGFEKVMNYFNSGSFGICFCFRIVLV